MFEIAHIAINSPLILAARNLRARWMRTILTALGIVIGVAAMVAVNVTNNSTLEAIERFFDETAGRADLVVETAVSGETFAADVWNKVRRWPQVTAVAPGVVGVTIPASEADGWEQAYNIGVTAVPGNQFLLLGRDPAADAQVHTYKLAAGRLLEPGETAYNVLLVEDYANEKNIQVGEDFPILTPGQGIVSLRVVGLITKEDIGITNEGVIGISPVNVVQDLFNLSGELNQLELVIDEAIAGDVAALSALRADLEAQLGSDMSVKYPASRGQAVANSLRTYQTGLDFFSVVSLFVGSFLIYNAFAMTVVERTREIGMYRAIGMTRAQVRRLVLAEALFLGLLGSVIGVGVGLLLAQGLTQTVGSIAGQAVDRVRATPVSLVTAVFVGVTVTLLAAMLPAYQAAHVSPLQALRVQATTDEGRWRLTGLRFGPLTVLASVLVLYRVPFRPEAAFLIGSNSIFVMMVGATLCIPVLVGPLERLIRPFIVLVFGHEGRLGSGNVERSQARTTLTVAALMVGISMVVGINGMTTSFETDMMAWIDSALGGDAYVQSPMDMRPDLEARLLSLPQVTAVTRARYVPTNLTQPNGEDEYALFIAIDPATYLTVRGLRVQEGPAPEEIIRQLAEGDTIWIGADVANKFNLHVGDEVLVETRRGKRPFRIVAIVIDFGGGETTTVTGSWDDLRRYFGVTDVSSFALRLTPEASLTAVTDSIENDLGRSQSLRVESKQEFEQKIRDLSAQAFSLFDVLALIGLVVGALGVINTMLMNVLERTRELGGLRSLGMTRRQVQRMILAEAATMGLIGGAFGVLFGAVLADVFLIGLRSIGGFVLSLTPPYAAMGYSFIVAFALSVGAALYPAWRAGRVNIITAVKHE